MLGLVTKLMVSGQLRFDKGKIMALGENVCMIPMVYVKSATRIALKHHRKEKNSRDLEELYFEAWTAGYEITKKMVREYKLRKFEERYKFAMDIISLFGFGDYRTIDFKRAHHSYFEVEKNPFALMFHPSSKKVDIFLSGANSGGGTIVHEVVMNCVERECAAINGKICKFVNCNFDLLREFIKKGEAYDFDWKFLLKKEIEYIKRDKDYGDKIIIPEKLKI